MTTQDRQQEIDKIHRLPSLLVEALRGLNDEQLDTPYREGGWTVRQVVHHLADSHLNAMIRMKLILTEERPTLKGYDQELWAELPDYDLPIEHSIMILKGLHDRWRALLEQMPDDAWSRSAIHPETGKVTLDDLLNTYAKHGENHLGQITGLKSSQGW